MNASDEEYQNKMIEAFIDKPEVTLWYQNAFSKFNTNGVDTMNWHWSWWAFGGGAAFLLYRKQYIAALVLFISSFVLGMIPFVSLIMMVLAGGYSSYFVYKGFKKKLREVEQNIDDIDKRLETMRIVGGYHSWVIWLYAIFSIFIVSYLAIILYALVR